LPDDIHQAEDRRQLSTLRGTSPLSLFAFGLTYSKDGRIKGSLLATTFFAAVMGFTALRSQKSDQL